MTRIKNCGLKTTADMDAAAESGASFIGFVHHAASPRHLTIPEMAALNLQKPARVQSVAVLVNPSDETLDAITASVRPDYLQLHKVDAVRAMQVAARTPLPLILGVAIRSAADIERALQLEAHAAHLLLDAPESGSGVPFDWAALQDLHLQKPWFLAGGLMAENVAEAIRITGAPMVDVSSGIEDRPGHKSAEKIAAFNRAVLNASHG